MKYKAAGIMAVLLVFLLSAAASGLTDDKNQRVHQHLEAEETAACSHEADVFCTHLPLVVIDTGGTEIPGKAVLDENGKILGYTQTENGEDVITAQMKIMDQEGVNHHTDDAPDVESLAEIHVRGNSSRTFDKSNYGIRFVTEQGENNPQSIMGMDAHHEWALHGPFLDKTLIRNYMWYNIAGEFMDYAPNVRFCEVIVNGEYMGLYVMTETITAGTDGARLSLSVNKKNNTFSGYLLRLDRGSDTELKNIRTFSAYTLRTKQVLDIAYPGIRNLMPEFAESIRQDFSDFEKTLYSYDYDSRKYGYRNYIDVESFADYFIINEFTCNYDAGWLSTYIYKDGDGKYRMCIWDFNSACDGYQESGVQPQHFEMQNCLWYFMLMKDEDFVNTIIRRYRELRKGVLSDEYLNAYIDDVVDYLGPAIERNYEKWGYSFEEAYDLLQPAYRNPRNYEQALQQMKGFLHIRSEWMDENIEALRQYGAESRVKKFNENAN